MNWLREFLASIVRTEVMKALAEYDKSQAARTEMVLSTTMGQTASGLLKRFSP